MAVDLGDALTFMDSQEVATICKRLRELNPIPTPKCSWQSTHHKKFIDGISRYQKEHPDKYKQWKHTYEKSEEGKASKRIRCARRRIRKALAIMKGDCNIDIWLDKSHLFNGHCSYCGEKSKRLHIDHITPISRGGDNSINNLTLSCAKCNLSKSDKLLSEWKNFSGLRIPLPL